MTATATSLSDLLASRFPGASLGAHHYVGDQTVTITRESLLPVATWLRDDPSTRMNFLMDLTCVDYLKFGKRLQSKPSMTTPSPLPYFMQPKPATETWQRQAGSEFRFEVVYHLYSLEKNHRLRVKVPVAAADPVVDSLTGLWQSADWFEREVWDMFGIRFTGHPNLKRILMYEGFEGHALRKDYPMHKRQPIIGPIN